VKLVKYISSSIRWNVFILSDIFDSRIQRFIKFLSGSECTIENFKNMECPFIKLLSTWDDYLTNVLDKCTGYDVQRGIKKF